MASIPLLRQLSSKFSASSTGNGLDEKQTQQVNSRLATSKGQGFLERAESQRCGFGQRKEIAEKIQGSEGPIQRASSSASSTIGSIRKILSRSLSLRRTASATVLLSLSDFEIKDKLGEGAFGNVSTAVWKASGMLVAVKTLRSRKHFESKVRPDERDDFYNHVLHAFRQEMKLLQLAGPHPHVIAFLGKTRDHKSFVTPVECCDLFQLVRASDRMLPLNITHQIAKGVISAVAHLHHLEIVHQDLKSQNVLIDRHGQPKLCDFGLAIRLRKDHAVDVSQEIVTLWYRPPELLLGCARYSAIVDCWAAGCIVLEMIHGDVPFRGHPSKVCSCPSRRHLNFNSDQLRKIFQVMGSPDANLTSSEYACAPHIADWPRYQSQLDTVIREGLGRRGPTHTAGETDKEDKLNSVQMWTELIGDLLHWDPDQRLRCDEALKLPIFLGALCTQRPLPAPESGQQRSAARPISAAAARPGSMHARSATPPRSAAVQRTGSAHTAQTHANALHAKAPVVAPADSAQPRNAHDLLKKLVARTPVTPPTKETKHEGVKLPSLAFGREAAVSAAGDEMERPVLEIGDLQAK